ncbi:MAG: AAA family ATPase [Nocardioides sp.]
MTSDRKAVITAVADLLPGVSRPLLAAVDGPDGVGKTHFADELAALLRARGRTVVRASVDDFHHPREHRHALGRTAESVWTRHFDYRALRRELLDPWLAGAGSSYRAAWHDVRRNEHVAEPEEVVPESGVLVVDGVFAQRPELELAWDLVVFLDAPPEVTVPRLAARDGAPADPDHPDQRRYLEAQRIYVETCGPRQLADVVVDNSDFSAPRVVDASACVPPGWAVDGNALVRTVRLPRTAADVAEAVNRVVDG